MKRIVSLVLSVLLIMSATVCAFAAESIEVGDVVKINYGATNYDGGELNRVFYYLTFTVTEIEGDKASLLYEITPEDVLVFGVEIPDEFISLVGLLDSIKIPLRTTVKVSKLKLYDENEAYNPYESYQYIVEGSLVTTKFGELDDKGEELGDYYNFVDGTVISIVNDIATVNCKINILETLEELDIELNDMLSSILALVPPQSLSLDYEYSAPLESLVLLDGEHRFTGGEETDTDNLLMFGDVNGDEEVSMEDVTTIQKLIAKLLAYDDLWENAEACADVDLNGNVDLVDVTIIQRYLAELIDTLPVA